MINLFKRLAGGAITLGLLSALPHLLPAQESPVLRVDITRVQVANGDTIAGITVLNGGSGYTTATVAITGGNGTGATATATRRNSLARSAALRRSKPRVV